jgi:hypothetical protein
MQPEAGLSQLQKWLPYLYKQLIFLDLFWFPYSPSR